jgi:hypothetical protein
MSSKQNAHIHPRFLIRSCHAAQYILDLINTVDCESYDNKYRSCTRRIARSLNTFSFSDESHLEMKKHS